MKLAETALERIAIVVASLVLSVGLIAVLSGFFQSHDPAGVSGSRVGDRGSSSPISATPICSPGELRPPYNSDPPTSGAHVPEPVLRDATTLTNDQLLEALELGDIVIVYGDQPAAARPARTRRRVVAGPFTPGARGRRPGGRARAAPGHARLHRARLDADAPRRAPLGDPAEVASRVRPAVARAGHGRPLSVLGGAAAGAREIFDL